MLRIVFPTDEHRPYHDPRAVEIALKITSDFRPNLRVAGSDGLDFYNISKYDKNPQRVMDGNLQVEIDSWAAGQREWRDASPDAAVYFLIGNHEDRLRKWLWRHPELYGLEVLRLPQLLQFEKLGIPWNEEAHTELELCKKLVIRHGDLVRQHSAYTAKAILEREYYARNVVFGHTHRGGSHYVTTRDGVVQAQEGFCLCRLDPEYQRNPNWQQGLVLIEVDEYVSIETVPFREVNGKLTARWRGKEY